MQAIDFLLREPGNGKPCARARPTEPASARTVKVKDGEALFRNGDPCERFVVLTRGVLRVQVVSRSGREIVLYRVRPGELCLATAANLMSGRPYRIDGIAEGDITGIQLTDVRFQAMMSDDAEFRSFVLSSLGARINDVVGLLQDVAFEGINSRLAQLLLGRCGTGAEVCETHERLALELGSAREVVSRRLKQFERSGWVQLSRGRIALLDVAALEDISNRHLD
jgi:CRP/FNR family transcriptional regulator